MMDFFTGLERRFWLEGAEFYRQQLDDDFLMLFAGVGLMRRAETIKGIEGGQRWDAVEIHAAHFLALFLAVLGLIVVGYVASAELAKHVFYAQEAAHSRSDPLLLWPRLSPNKKR